MAWKVIGLSHRPMIIVSRPASIRLAMAISPSRLSSSTAPISRRYMRTGSSVRSPVVDFFFSGTFCLGFVVLVVRPIGAISSTVVVVLVLARPRRSRRSGRPFRKSRTGCPRSGRSSSRPGQRLVELVIGDVALALRLRDQLLDRRLVEVDQRERRRSAWSSASDAIAAFNPFPVRRQPFRPASSDLVSRAPAEAARLRGHLPESRLDFQLSFAQAAAARRKRLPDRVSKRAVAAAIAASSAGLSTSRATASARSSRASSGSEPSIRKEKRVLSGGGGRMPCAPIWANCRQLQASSARSSRKSTAGAELWIALGKAERAPRHGGGSRPDSGRVRRARRESAYRATRRRWPCAAAASPAAKCGAGASRPNRSVAARAATGWNSRGGKAKAEKRSSSSRR